MKTTIKVAPLFATLITIESLSGGAIAQTVVNGSFETNSNFVAEGIQITELDIPSNTQFSSAASATGWTFSNVGAGLVEDFDSLPDGNYAGAAAGGGTISQVINFAPGDYVLNFSSFTALDRTGSYNYGISGIFSESATENGADHLATLTTRQFEVVTAGSYTLSFQSVGIVSGTTAAFMGFDDVSINQVPEPSSALLLGFAGLGFILRRRR